MRIERGNRRGKDSKKAEEKKKKKTSWNFEEEKICYALERSGVVGHKERIHHDSLTLRRMSFLRGKSSLRFSLLFKEIQDVALKKDCFFFTLQSFYGSFLCGRLFILSYGPTWVIRRTFHQEKRVYRTLRFAVKSE